MRYQEMLHIHYDYKTIAPIIEFQNMSLLARVLALRQTCNIP